ncbi:MAG: beta-lactamase family protein [Planctomycetes bacterium]|nr:beta-lactamase family protein [Planctomycetota bacterium]MBL7143257.1 beta-lactamase family protein [Phycisphaerae bacterium]
MGKTKTTIRKKNLWRSIITGILGLLALMGLLNCVGCQAFRTIPQTGQQKREDMKSELAALIDEFRTSVPKLMKKAMIPGVAIALFDRKGIIWTEGFGTTDLKRKIPVTPDTLFHIGSISKTFTATAVLLAVQDGLLDLDEPVTTYLPNFKVYSRYEANPEQKITLRHLLSHCAGIPHETSGCNMLEVTDSFEDRVRSLYGTWLKCPVGQGYSYSGAGYDLAAYVLQTVSGIPFQQYMTERVFQSFGLFQSTIDHNDIHDSANLAIGHTIGIAENPPAHGMLGAGGIWMSASDLAQFTRLLMNRGTFEGKHLLDESLIDAMLTPHAVAYEEDQWLYGLGIMLGKKQIGKRDVHILQHGGGGGGYQTLYEYYPEYGIGAVVLTNRVPHSVLSDLIIGRRLLEEGVLENRYPAPAWDIQQCTLKWTGWADHTPSAYKSEWKKYCGRYKCRFSGYKIKWWAKLALALDLDKYTPRIKVFEKKGYLCLTESKLLQSMNHYPYLQVDEKLEEVEPGLFFTASGSALDLRGEIPTWRNYRLKKR